MQFKIIHGIIVNVDGGLAQLGERLPYKQRVGGSSPSASTMNKRETDSNLINKAEPFFYICFQVLWMRGILLREKQKLQVSLYG